MKIILKNSNLLFKSVGPRDIGTNFYEGTNIMKVVPPSSGAYVGGKNFACIDDIEDTINGVTYSVKNGIITLNGTSTGGSMMIPIASGGLVLPDAPLSCRFTFLSGSATARFSIKLQYTPYGGKVLDLINTSDNHDQFNSGLLRENSNKASLLAIHASSGTTYTDVKFRILVCMSQVSTEYENSSLPVFTTEELTPVVGEYVCVQSIENSTVTIK